MNCPRCEFPAEQNGTAAVASADGRALAVAIFQCDRCEVAATMFGLSVKTAYTFAVLPDGSRVDADSLPDSLPHNG